MEVLHIVQCAQQGLCEGGGGGGGGGGIELSQTMHHLHSYLSCVQKRATVLMVKPVWLFIGIIFSVPKTC